MLPDGKWFPEAGDIDRIRWVGPLQGAGRHRALAQLDKEAQEAGIRGCHRAPSPLRLDAGEEGVSKRLEAMLRTAHFASSRQHPARAAMAPSARAQNPRSRTSSAMIRRHASSPSVNREARASGRGPL